MQNDALEPELIAGNDRTAETRFVDAAEEEELLFAIGHVAQAEDCRALSHGLDDQHARHDRVTREVSLEELFVRGDVLQTDDPLPVFDLDNAIDQQHRVAMRQEFHDFGDGEHGYLASLSS